MESKITIEIHEDGTPYLFIKFRPSDDLRDKVLSRFFTTSGVFLVEPKEVKLTMSVLVPNDREGEHIALIEPITGDIEPANIPH